MKIKKVTPHIKKRFGEIGEIATIFKAKLLGFSVGRPYGDSDPFDLFFCWPPTGRLNRIQVKTTACLQASRYRVHLKPHQRHRPHDVDFVIAYIVPCQAWYILPMSKAAVKGIQFSPNARRTRCWTEPYREAWHLLK